MPGKECIGKRAVVFNTYALTVCALLTALSVILARLLTIIPSEISRFSLEARPHPAGRTAVWSCPRRGGGLRRRFHRLSVLPLRL